MENKNKRLYLLSSNASKEYILDVLEVLSLPFGMVQHFRYQLKWLDADIKKILPCESEKNKIRELKKQNYELIICYLYQEKLPEQKGKWTAVYPIRAGKLVEAYKTGNEDDDIAHFYFKVTNYIDECENIIEQILCATNPGDYIDKEGVRGKTLVFWDDNLSKIAPKKDSYSAFSKICKSLKQDHFISPEGDTKYYPLFCYIEGLKSKKGEYLTPKYDVLSHRAYYEISEGSKYSFNFKTFFSEKPQEFSVMIKSDVNLFSTHPKYTFKISSRYTEEDCLLISKFLEKDIYTVVSFETDCNLEGKEPLNLRIDFSVKIKRNLLFRIIEVTGDIGFGIGTASIALSKMVEQWHWWYWPVIIGYSMWMICKLTVKFLWRG